MTPKSRLFGSLLIALFSTAAIAQSSVFTYQGKLFDQGIAANGQYQLEFRIYNAPTDGTQIGTTISDVAVSVTQGVFTTQLDLGPSIFAAGKELFIELGVRRNTGESYVTLSPRQQLTSAPYAIKALLADTAAIAGDSYQLGGVDANDYVQTDHPGMTDARVPLPGSADYIQNTSVTQPLSNFNISGDGRANIFSAAVQFNIGGDRVLTADANMNTFTGIGTGGSNSGTGNSFFGRNAGRQNSIGSENSLFGAEAGLENSQGSFNSFFGALAGRANTIGNNNSFFGTYAGRLNIDANSNSFFGANAGAQTTSGSMNSFFGTSAGTTNQTGTNNSFFGVEAGNFNVSGSNNTYFGKESGRQGLTQNNNAFFGTEAGRNNTAHSNSYFGFAAGRESSSGINNVFVGAEAGRNNLEGDANVFVGRSSGINNVGGDQNTYIGVLSGAGTSQGFQNTLIGALATMPFLANLTNATAIGANAVVSQSNSLVLGDNANVGIGTSAPQSKLTVVGLIESTTGGVKFPDGSTQTSAFSPTFAILNQSTLQAANFNINGTGTANILRANTHFNLGADRILSAGGIRNLHVGVEAGLVNAGSDNTMIGNEAGENTTTGGNNTMVGSRAGSNNTQGNRNVFIGSGAGSSTLTGSQNIAIGVSANAGGTDGLNSTSVGYQAGLGSSGMLNSFFGMDSGRSSSGSQNTYIGSGAGNWMNGVANVALGVAAGNDPLTAEHATLLGYATNLGADNLTYATAIGSGAIVSTSSTIAMGRPDGSDKVRIFGLGVAGSTFLCRNSNNEIATCSSSLRYKTNTAAFSPGLDIVKRLRPITFDWKDSGVHDLGLGAEDVAAVSELLVTRNKDGEIEGVKYDRIGVVLINVVREQQAELEDLKKQISELKKLVSNLALGKRPETVGGQE
jgi:hypothetical protein